MKKYSLYMLLTVLLIMAGCNKKKQPDSTNSNNNTTSSGDPNDHPIFYSINGFHDVTVNKGIDTTISMPVSIGFYPSKVGVSINVDKLPGGVTVTPRSLTVYDSFDTTFVFMIKIAP